MPKYVALLRGINVGGRIIKMADLKDCFSGLDFNNVQTILQTGNVIFETEATVQPALKEKIEAALSQQFNYPAKIFLYKQADLKNIIDNYPLKQREGYHNYVVFTDDTTAKELARQAPNLDPSLEQIVVKGPIVYWQVQKGMTLKSQFGKSKLINATTRNLNTLNKIAAK